MGDICYPKNNILLFQGTLNGNFGQLQCAVLSGAGNTYDESQSFGENLLKGLAAGVAESAASEPQYQLTYTANSIQITGVNTFTACGLAWTRLNTGFAAPGQPHVPNQASGAVQTQYGLACLHLDPNLPLTKVSFQFRIGNRPWQTSDTAAGYVSSLYYPLTGGNPPVSTIQFQSAFNGGQGAVTTDDLTLDPTPTNDCTVSLGRKYRWALKQGSNYHVDLVQY